MLKVSIFLVCVAIWIATMFTMITVSKINYKIDLLLNTEQVLYKI
jgi:hypothetical protein